MRCTCMLRRSAWAPQKASDVAVCSGAVASQVCSDVDMPCMNQIKAQGARLHSDEDSWPKMRTLGAAARGRRKTKATWLLGEEQRQAKSAPLPMYHVFRGRGRARYTTLPGSWSQMRDVARGRHREEAM